MKKSLSLFLTMALTCALIPNPAAALTPPDATNITSITGNLTVNASNSPATISGTVTIPSGVTLTVAADGNLTVSGTVTVESGGTVTVNGVVDIASTGKLVVTAGTVGIQSDATVTNNGVIELQGGTMTNSSEHVSSPGIIVQKTQNGLSGTLLTSGFIKVDITNVPAWIDIFGTNNVWTELQNNYLNGSGDYGSAAELRIGGGRKLTVPQNETLSLTADGAKLHVQNTLDVYGTVLVNTTTSDGKTVEIDKVDAQTTVFPAGVGAVTVHAGGSFIVETGTVVMEDNVSIINNGTITSQGTFTISTGATVENSSILNFTGGTLTNNGTVHSPGITLIGSGMSSVSGNTIVSGFQKFPDGGLIRIDVYGEGNEWTNWHNAFLNGTANTEAGLTADLVGNVAQLRIRDDATLTIPEDVNLALSATTLGTNYQLWVKNSLTVNGTITLNVASTEGAGIRIGHSGGAENPAEPAVPVTISSSGKVIVQSGQLWAEAAANITNDGQIEIAGGEFHNTSQNVTNNGTLTITSGSLNNEGKLTNAGTIAVAAGGTLTNGGTITNNGAVTYAVTGVTIAGLAADALPLETGSPTKGTLQLNATVEPPLPTDITGATHAGTVAWAISGTDEGKVSVNATTGVVTALKNGSATITATAGGVTSAPVTITVEGQTISDDLTELTVNEDNTPVTISTSINAGNITIANGATLNIADGGSLTLSGTLTNNGTLNNSGTLANNSTITISGSGSLTGSGTVTGTGIIEATSEITLANGSTHAVLRDITGGKQLDVYGTAQAPYLWSQPLQDRLELTDNTGIKQINLVKGTNSVLSLQSKGLYVPATHVLTIKGGSTPGKIVAQSGGGNGNGMAYIPQAFQFHAAPPLPPNGDEDADNAGKVVSDGLIIWDTDGAEVTEKGKVILKGFYAELDDGTYDAIHVLGEVTWPEAAESDADQPAVLTAFAAGKTLVVDEDATLDISNGLTVPEDATLVVEKGGTLTVPAGATLTVEGELTGKGTLNIQGATAEETKAGKVELKGNDATLSKDITVEGEGLIVEKASDTAPEFISLQSPSFSFDFPATGQNISGNEVFVVSYLPEGADERVPLDPTTDYTVGTPANGEVTISAATNSTKYTGSVTKPYTAVTKVEITGEDVVEEDGTKTIHLYARTATDDDDDSQFTTGTLTVTVTAGEDGDEEASNQNVYWEIPAGTTGITVSPTTGSEETTYTVSAAAAGNYTLTVHTVEGVHTDAVSVKVGNLPVEGIEIYYGNSPAKDVLIPYSVPVGSTLKFSYQYQPPVGTGIVQDQPNVVWSSKHGYASVDKDGKVTGVSAGTDTVYAKVSEVIKDSVAINVHWVSVSGVSIQVAGIHGTENVNGTRYTFNKRDTLLLTAVLNNDASDKRVSWKSLDPDTATVDQNGVVRGVRDGVAKIVVTTFEGEKTDFIIVRVYTIGVEGVTIANKDYYEANPLEIGKEYELKATVTPNNATNKEVTWKSDNEKVATVTKISADSVKVTGVSAGKAKIIVTTVDSARKDTIQITVVKIDVESVTIDAVIGEAARLENDTLWLQKDSTARLEWTVNPDNATKKEVTWKIDNTAVATVSADGKVTGLSAGTAQLTVTADGGKKATVTIVVYPVHVESVTISGDKEVRLQKDDTLRLEWEVLPEDANNKAVTWKSSNPAVATVNAAGKVTAVANGEAQITVTSVDSARTDAITVTVYTVYVESVSITADKDSLNRRETLQLTALVLPEDANDKTVTWRSLTPDTATVDQNGVVKGIRDGIATITAITYDGEYRDTISFKVYSVPVGGVRITHKDYTEVVDTLPIGETLDLIATVTPDDATDKTVVWTSSDAAVATVSDGTVTGVAEGEAIIYAAAGDKTDSVVIKVYYTAVTGVTIANKAAIAKDSLPIGETLELHATVAPIHATYNSVTWKSGNEAVATVSANGLVTAIAAGKATIYVTTDEGNKQDSVTITVYAIRVEGVTIAAAGSVAVGDTLRLHATVTPENAFDKSVTWSSGNKAVATVDANGLVTGVSEGEAPIYVTTVDGGHKDSVIITVYAIRVEGVTIAGADSLAAGKTLKLTATVEPQNATNKAVTWRSGNTAVATVSSSGTVTGKTAGEALIYVTTVDGEFTDSVKITVYTEEVVPQPIPVEGVTIAGATDSLKAGSTLQLTAVITPEEADNKAVTWSSSDDAVATVSETGLVTGVAEGEAIITVTTEDGEFTASVTIAVYTEEVVPQPIPVTGVTIAGATDSLETGSTLQLTAVITPEDADVDYFVAWTSSDEDVATVDAGLVTGKADGVVTIYVTVTTADAEYKDSVAIAVYTEEVIIVPHITEVAIASDSTWTNIVTFLPEYNKETKYGTLQLTAVVTVEPADSTVAYTTVWESGNTDVATVSETGLVTAVAEGDVTITLTVTETATGETFTATLEISIQTVGIAPVPVTSVKAYIAENTLYVNSAVTEKVDIYTISGKLVYSAVKPAGEVQIALYSLSDGVLIIRGASGWVQKIVK